MQVPVQAVDGSRLDLGAAQAVAQGAREVWLAAPLGRDPDGAARAAAAGLEVRPFGYFALLHVQASGVPPARQAQALLGWAAATDPGAGAALALAKAATRPPTPAADMVPTPATAAPPAPGVYGPNGNEPPEQWMLWPGTAALPGGEGFLLQPAGGEINVTLRTRQARIAQTYLLAFQYRNRDLVGPQRVYVSTHSADGRWLTTFPAGAGYLCPPASDWATQGFAFTLPPETDTTILWFRASGTGSAEVRQVTLQPLP
jgi:hypothetical protein